MGNAAELQPSHLRRLAIRCPQFTERDLTSIIGQERLGRLKDLDLSQCREFVDAHAQTIAIGMKHLHELNLSQTRVTGTGIKTIVNGLPDLRFLTIDDCPKVTSDTILWLQQRGWSYV